MPRQRASIRVSGSELRLQRFKGTIAVGTATTTPVLAFDPTSVSSLVGWYDFSDITTLYKGDLATPVTADGDAIGSVSDKSLAGNKLGASAGTDRPTYKTGIQNSLSVGRFDGSANYLRLTLGTTLGGDLSVFIVANKRTAVGAGSKTLFGIGTTAAQFYTDSGSSSTFNWYSNQANGVSSDLGGTPAAWEVIGLVFVSTSSVETYFDGTAGATFDPKDDYSTGLIYSFGAAADNSNPSDYDIGEILVCSAAVSSSDRASIVTFLKTKWGIA